MDWLKHIPNIIKEVSSMISQAAKDPPRLLALIIVVVGILSGIAIYTVPENGKLIALALALGGFLVFAYRVTTLPSVHRGDGGAAAGDQPSPAEPDQEVAAEELTGTVKTVSSATGRAEPVQRSAPSQHYRLRLYHVLGVIISVALCSVVLWKASRPLPRWLPLQPPPPVNDVSGVEPFNGVPTQSVSYLAFSPVQPNILAIGGRDGRVLFWDTAKNVEDGKALSLGLRFSVNQLAYSRAGKKLAALQTDPDEPHPFLLDLSENASANALGDALTASAIALSPDGRVLAVADSPPGVATRLWTKESGFVSLSIDQGAHPRSLAFSPNGKYLASAVQRRLRLYEVDRGDPGNSKEAKNWPTDGPSQQELMVVVISPDSQKLAVADYDGTVWVLSLPDLTECFTEPKTIHPKGVASLAFSPRGDILASGGGLNDPIIWLWDVVGKKQRAAQPQLAIKEVANVKALAFSSDGQMLAVGIDTEHTVRLWKLNDSTGRYERLPPKSQPR